MALTFSMFSFRRLILSNLSLVCIAMGITCQNKPKMWWKSSLEGKARAQLQLVVVQRFWSTSLQNRKPALLGGIGRWSELVTS